MRRSFSFWLAGWGLEVRVQFAKGLWASTEAGMIRKAILYGLLGSLS